MGKTEIVEREKRLGRILGAVGLLGFVLYFAANFINIGEALKDAENLPETLVALDGGSNAFLIANILTGLGMAMFAAPIYFLFTATSARSETMRSALVGLAVFGPLFFGAYFVARYFAYEAASAAFIDPGGSFDLGSEQAAEDVLAEQSAWSLSIALRLGGSLALTIALTYTGLHAMRTGLLTRFWGSLTMALGVSILLLGPFGLLPVVVAFSLLALRKWPGQLPPAWDAGEAVPWPDGGRGGAPPPSVDEEPARPEDFVDAEAREIDPRDEESTRPGRRDNRRKRKQRG